MMKAFPAPQQKRLTPRQTLDALVEYGYRPYICGDPGYGVVIAWAQTIYREDPWVWEPVRWRGVNLPTEGRVPDWGRTVDRVADAIGCNNVKIASFDPSLEHLLSSSIKVVVDDEGVPGTRTFDLDKSQIKS